jgi:hypothetical protein
MHIYLTDKTGAKFWNTDVTAGFAQGERANLQRHLAAIKAGHPAYELVGIDRETARIVEKADVDISDAQLLAALAADNQES